MRFLPRRRQCEWCRQPVGVWPRPLRFVSDEDRPAIGPAAGGRIPTLYVHPDCGPAYRAARLYRLQRTQGVVLD